MFRCSLPASPCSNQYLCVDPLRLAQATRGTHKRPHTCRGKVGDAGLSTQSLGREQCDRRGGSRGHEATPLRLDSSTDRSPETQRRQRRGWDTTGMASHQAWNATNSRLGVTSSRCAQGKAGCTHPSVRQGRRTHPSRRPRAADSSEPPTPRTKTNIDMSRQAKPRRQPEHMFTT